MTIQDPMHARKLKKGKRERREREKRKTTFYYLIFFPDAVYVQNFKTTCYNQVTFRKHDEGALSRDISFSGKNKPELFLLCFRTSCSLSFFFFNVPSIHHAIVMLFFSATQQQEPKSCLYFSLIAVRSDRQSSSVIRCNVTGTQAE